MTSHKGRKPKSYSQAARINLMARRLTGGATVKELADQFQITKRQVHRDLQHLEESGHPLEHENDRYKLPLGFKGLEIVVSPYELMSLYFAKCHLDYLKGTSLVDDLEAVIQKVETGLPYKVRNHLERIVTAFKPFQRPIRDYATKKNVLDSLRKALLRQLTVVLRGYQKPGEKKLTDYKVAPYVLVLYQNGLYLTGYSHSARDLRTFAVERIDDVEITEDIFDLPKSFSLEKRFEQSFGLIEESLQEVKIRISPEWAYFVRERKWHPTQTLREQKDGSVILTMKCGGLDELTAWILSFGPGAKVLGPPELVEKVSRLLTLATKSYHPSR